MAIKHQSGGWLEKRLYKTVDATKPYPDTFSEKVSHVMNFISGTKQETKEPVSDAAWRKRLGLAYNKELLPDNPDSSVRLPKHYEQQILTDTTAVKKRIADNMYMDEDEMKYKDRDNYNVIQKDRDYLRKLRRMYNNEDTIDVNEFQASKGRDFSKNTPLNVMQNFKMYMKDGKVNYEDDYDFNDYENIVPGKSFKIRGIVK